MVRPGQYPACRGPVRGRLWGRAAALKLALVQLASAVALHLQHDAGHAHQHVGGVTLWSPLLAPPDSDDANGLEEHHRRFDAELALVDLSEAAHFGVADVDCSVADYTLVDCVAGAPVHTFGDRLVAQEHRAHPHRAPFERRRSFRWA